MSRSTRREVLSTLAAGTLLAGAAPRALGAAPSPAAPVPGQDFEAVLLGDVDASWSAP